MMKEYYTFEDEPCRHTDSCLGAKLMRLAPITNRQEELLSRLESEESDIVSGSVLLKEGAPADELIILKSGWVTSGKTAVNGSTSISQIHHPGDVVGFENLAFSRVKNTCVAESPLRACRISTAQLNQVFEESPRISALLLALSAVEQAIMSDRVMIARRTDSEMRLALFLLQTLSRLSLMNSSIYDQFHCPLTQQQIGDATGLTGVHVSRTLKKLEDRGYIRKSRQFIQIMDEKSLADMVEFVDRYQDLDLSWLPES
ncbi:MAG: hypothetical protein CBB65_02475 [Hyphomonadaceae bacterium TMED5]|nr:MAG: hypothetical protein CBB65_02475 [Hyphomonadaceae bacterium TMED5]|tara:strand:+ start:1489 stop:2262 length:774 start_codon:yes stop_codon:yes gene_type:complete